GPQPIIKAMATLQGHVTSNAASLVQAAGIAALEGPQEPIDAMVADYAGRRQLVLSKLASMPGITCQRPGGAFYVFPDVSGLMGKTLAGRTIDSSNTLAEILLEEARVAVVPGEGFGAPG